tara:strand:+ start:330 stop:1718 length:1389 start_codon:yes stop_codon:yes gene_type:complete
MKLRFISLLFLITGSLLYGVKPNIIFIMADDLGYGHLGAYGQELIRTPAIDEMAQNGLVLTDYYAGTSVCAPSRCSLMTGQNVGNTFIRGNYEIKGSEINEQGQLPIPDETITVAERLKEAGYTTACIGKWGLGYPKSEGDPLNQGFDHFYGYNCQRLAHNYYPGWLWRNHEKVNLGKRYSPEGYSHYSLTDEALDFIENNSEAPFFLYLSYAIPHSHIQIPEEDSNYTQYQEEDWPEVQKKLAGMISLMDQDVGRIIKSLEELGIDNETLVVFTSDNGAHNSGGVIPDFFNCSGPLRGIKRDLYEGGIRVPFVAYWPSVIEPGSESNHLATHWDLMATACDMADLDLHEGTNSISYLPLIKGDLDSQKAHDYLYFELHWPSRRAARKDQWVAVQQNTTSKDPSINKIELFDLENDLSQSKNLADQYPGKIAEFKEIFSASHVPSEHFIFGQRRPHRARTQK